MQRTVVVIGGGISGLTACYHLSKNSSFSKVVLLESSGRLGGWIRSSRTEDGAIFEHGPRALRTAGAPGRITLQMVSELGLEKEILPVTGENPASKNRYLYVHGKIHKLPSGLSGVVTTTSPFTRPLVWTALRELIVRSGKDQDETMHAFFERRFGKELADIAIDSLCRGVFAGDCRKLSIRSCFPMIFEAERQSGSVIVGMMLSKEKDRRFDSNELFRRSKRERWSQWSLREGLQMIPEAMEDALKTRGVEIHVHTPVERLGRTTDCWEVRTSDGTIKADHIFSAAPAKALSSLLRPSAKPLAEQLNQLHYVTVAVVNLEYEGSVIASPGFGHLVPSFEERSILGIVYDSVAFPEHDRNGAPSTRLTVMLGGDWFAKDIGDPEKVSHEQLLQIAAGAVRRHLGVQAEPIRHFVHVQKDCIPQYTLGHWKRLEHISGYLRYHRLPLGLIGASYQGVSVNDCIYRARIAVEKLSRGITSF
ncbi:protoporphyrinogen oxidase [Protopterus annectens]|uniref:protoporphyrinogen oxidase n=1 Tax=Protopterus annectens TaxID=7888 RepID=UPI001CFBE2A5|nr:protoporphyrinogen oxidase [Protopterus annectens]